ncbi:cubilin homolog [Branchiostoma floridae]|uniref:Cubilin homolog n=2 Tax=Branchiostoma floridae TaxID=7739 RepID=A0A9J7MXP1_BRAFL|nr:cubilin homolog [Branchiostoma floridae]
MYDRISISVTPTASNTPSGASDTITCEACQDGYKCVNGDEVEEICPAGTISRSDGTACDPCAAGEFSGAAGSTTCQQCPAGQFNTQSGSSSCQPCPAGKYSSSTGSTECQVCPAGRYSSRGSSSCTRCPAGRYSPSSGSSSCQSCPAGEYSSSSGSTSCQSCPAGQYNTRQGSTSCQSCPAGQYSGSSGSTGCLICQAGSTSSVGATVCTDINECQSNPCQNGGICQNMVDRYSCTCSGYFEGDNCETAAYTHLGCYRQSDGTTNVMASMEGHFGTGYQNRDGAILRCYTVAEEAGYNLFALEDGGMCRGGNDQIGRYRVLGFSQNCGNDGKGGDNAIDVYLIPGKATWLPSRGSWIVDQTQTYDNNRANRLFDVNDATYWNPVGPYITAPRYHNRWFFAMDLTVPHTLTRIRFKNYGDTTHDIRVFKLQMSQVGSPYDWDDVKSVTDVQAGTTAFQEFGSFQGTARYWKFLVTRTHEGYQPWAREVDFYGFPSV